MSRTESRPLLSGSVELGGAEPAPFRSLTAASPAPPTHGRLSPMTTSIFMMPGLLESMAWWTVQGQARFGLGSRDPSALGRGWRPASGVGAMSGYRCRWSGRHGFTLIELLVVINGRLNGLFLRAATVTFASVTDGNSNTLAFGEKATASSARRVSSGSDCAFPAKILMLPP